MSLAIDKIETDKDRIVRNNNAGVIPTHPFRALIVGSSGSGKTNLIVNLMTKPQFYGDYFDIIAVFSPNVKLDKIWQATRIDFPYDNLDNFDADLIELVTRQKATVERKGIARAPRMLIVVDDFVDNKRVASSKNLVALFTKGRHWNISTICGSQKYKGVDRTIRLNASDVIMFAPDNESEMKQLAEEQAKQITKKQFTTMVERVTSTPYSFIYIRPAEQLARRYKKGFSEIISIQ